MSQNESKSRVKPFKQLLHYADNLMILLTGVALVFLTFMITTDVASRFLFNKPFRAGTEISELLMAYIVFLALGYTLSLNIHIRITAVLEYFPIQWKLAFEVLADIFGLLFCAFVTFYAWKFFWHSFSIREELLAVVKLPLYVGKFAMPLGFFFFTLHYLVHLIETVRKFSGHGSVQYSAGNPNV